MNLLPELWLIAGPNGAGKTSITRYWFTRKIPRSLGDVRILNPDDWALEILRKRGFLNFCSAPHEELQAAFISAAQQVEALLVEETAANRTIGVETVLSSGKYRD